MKVFKYPLLVSPMQVLMLPTNSKVVLVGRQGKALCLWCEVPKSEDAQFDLEERTIYVLGTGHPFPDVKVKHLGSFIDGPYVWHIYEEIK